MPPAPASPGARKRIPLADAPWCIGCNITINRLATCVKMSGPGQRLRVNVLITSMFHCGPAASRRQIHPRNRQISGGPVMLGGYRSGATGANTRKGPPRARLLPFPSGRVISKMATGAICALTRQRFRAKHRFFLPRYQQNGHWCNLCAHAASNAVDAHESRWNFKENDYLCLNTKTEMRYETIYRIIRCHPDNVLLLSDA